ncbi:PKD domain-containing protein [Deinococcus altitudinis]|uniref:PKD domain-containing protein n=1 Tax=Deinococcus altitudinis TaxID=468914 RepID=UPI0038929147
MNRHAWTGLLFAAALTACAPPPVPPAPPPVTTMVTLSGTVRSTVGVPIAGVTVSVVGGTPSARSDAKGHVSLPLGTGQTVTLKLQKPGFTEQFKVVNVAASARAGSFRAEMLQRQPARILPKVEAGGKAVSRDGVLVELPANALVNAAGQAVTGSVNVTMTPVNVVNDEVGAFPGRFEGASAGGATTPLVSYGTVEYEFTQNGQELNLAPGKAAQIEMPFYARKHPDGSAVKAGDSVPLWSLNERTGLWQQEGTGSVVASGMSPTGLALRATVSHFSWWNIDVSPETATIRVRCLEKRPEFVTISPCTLTGRVLSEDRPVGVADTEFDSLTEEFSAPKLIPAGVDVRLSVCAEVRTSIDNDLGNDRFPQACGYLTVNRPSGSSSDVTVQLEVLDEIRLRLVQPTGHVKTDGTLNIEAVLDSGTPERVEFVVFDINRQQFVILKSFTTAPYSFAWDTRTFKQGFYILHTRAIRGQERETAPDIYDIEVDRNNPPPVSSFTHSPVLTDTAFTFAFDPAASRAQGTGTIETLTWDFGDGDLQVVAGKSVVKHRYLSPGTYTVSLTVEDLDGERTTSTQPVAASITSPLGTIVLERTGVPLATRSGTTFTASIVNNPQVTTWEARYSSSHPIVSLRGQCVRGNSGEGSGCSVVRQPGETFTFSYIPDSPFRVTAERPDAAFEAYSEPITVTASTPLGAFAQFNALLEVPAMPTLPVSGTLTASCTEISQGAPALVQRLFRFTAPGDWFALQLTPDRDISVSLVHRSADGFENTARTNIDATRTTLTTPFLGAGQPSAMQVSCLTGTGDLNLASTFAAASGILEPGREQAVTLSSPGAFYLIRNLPATPPVVFDDDSFLNVGGTGGLASLHAASGAALSTGGCSSCAFFGVGTRLGLPVSASAQFALMLRPSANLGAGTNVRLLAALPQSPSPLAAGQTLDIRLPSGLLPALVDLSAPAGTWGIVRNNQNLFLEARGGSWARAFPNYNSRQARSWLAAVSDGTVQRLHVSPHTAFSDENFIPLGLNAAVTMQAPVGALTPGVAVSGRLSAPYDNNPPGLGSGSLDYAHLYTFRAAASQKVALSLPASPPALVFVVIAPNGNVVRQCNAQLTTAAGCAASFTVPGAGEYAVVVHSALTQTAQTYNFTLNFLP